MRHDLAFCQLLRSKGFVTHDDYPASGGGGHGARTSSSLYGIGVKKCSGLASFPVKGRVESQADRDDARASSARFALGSEQTRERARNGSEVAVRFICQNKHVAKSGIFALVFPARQPPRTQEKDWYGLPCRSSLVTRSGHATRRPLPSGSRSRYPPRFRAACAVPKFQYRPRRPSQLPGSVFPAAS